LIPLNYKGQWLQSKLKVDLWIARTVIVEAKAIESLRPIHESQLITYLKLTGSPAGLLINFNEVLPKHGLKRLDRPDLYFKKKSS
jgi:GxxExxY protein